MEGSSGALHVQHVAVLGSHCALHRILHSQVVSILLLKDCTLVFFFTYLCEKVDRPGLPRYLAVLESPVPTRDTGFRVVIKVGDGCFMTL